MPAQSSLSPVEKAQVQSALQDSVNKIFTAAPARVYFAHPQPNKWSYGGLQGVLAFTYDKSKGVFVLKLVDCWGTRKVTWEHELYEGFEYFQDRPFFHSFAGDECMIGLVFSSEKDAKVFYKKVTNRKAEKGTPEQCHRMKKAKKGGKIDKTMISGPQAGSFKHVAHVGFDEEKGYTSTNVDPSWLTFLDSLKSHGITQDLINQNMDFIKEFVRDAQNDGREQGATPKKKPPPPPVPRRGAPPPPPPPPSEAGVTASIPPPQPGRADLLASIRGQSVSNLRKTPAPSSTPPPPPAPAAEDSSSSNGGGGGGGDLTAALAAALLQRSKKLGDSDDEDDDDDEWD
ncbi:hypothetical protein BU15DRAFT_46108 [Melanogaster broomeanus]|nr:hypothetical protein BU15DRAFT_46108 [Melanogaster broomeanus]